MKFLGSTSMVSNIKRLSSNKRSSPRRGFFAGKGRTGQTSLGARNSYIERIYGSWCSPSTGSQTRVTSEVSSGPNRCPKPLIGPGEATPSSKSSRRSAIWIRLSAAKSLIRVVLPPPGALWMTNGRSQSVSGSISNTPAPKFLRKLRTSRCCSVERDRNGFQCGLMDAPDCAVPGEGIVHGVSHHRRVLKYRPTTAPQHYSGCCDEGLREARVRRSRMTDHYLPWPCVHRAAPD